jgi:hypothetical protein
MQIASQADVNVLKQWRLLDSDGYASVGEI